MKMLRFGTFILLFHNNFVPLPVSCTVKFSPSTFVTTTEHQPGGLRAEDSIMTSTCITQRILCENGVKNVRKS